MQARLINFKSKVDKLDNDKLAPASADLSKLSNVVNHDVLVNHDVVKKTECKTKIKNTEDK